MASIDAPCVMVHLTLVCSYSFNAQTILTNTVTLYNLWWSCWFTFELHRYTLTCVHAVHGCMDYWNPRRNHACVRSGSDNHCIISHHHQQCLCTSHHMPTWPIHVIECVYTCTTCAIPAQATVAWHMRIEQGEIYCPSLLQLHISGMTTRLSIDCLFVAEPAPPSAGKVSSHRSLETQRSGLPTMASRCHIDESEGVDEYVRSAWGCLKARIDCIVWCLSCPHQRTACHICNLLKLLINASPLWNLI